MDLKSKYQQLRENTENLLKEKGIEAPANFFSEIDEFVEKLISNQYDREDVELSNAVEELNAINEELKQSNEMVEQERKLFLSILDNIPEIIYVADIHTHEILFANKQLKETIGRDITGEDCFKAIQGKDNICEFCTNKYIRDTNEPYFWEYFNTILDKHVYIMDRKIKWTDQKEVRFELAIDITERKKAEEENKKLSVAIEQSPANIVITDLKGKIEYVNPSFTKQTGYTKEEAIGINPRILKSGKTKPEVFAQLWNTITAGKIWKGEFINKTKNGEEYIEKATIAPIFNQQNKKTHYIAIKEDVTEKVKFENQVKESEEKYRIAFENANIGIMNVSTDGKILYANKECSNILGFSTDELITKTVNDIAVPEDKNISTRFIRSALNEKAKDKAVFEKSYFHKSGNIITCQISSTLLHDQNGNPLYFISHIKDITQQKQAELNLRKSEEKYRLITENASDVIWILNLSKKAFTYISPSVFALRGYTPEEAMAQDINQSLTRESAKEVTDSIAEIVLQFLADPEKISKKIHRNELRQKCKDGSIIWIETSTRYQFNANNEIEVIGISRNIDDRKQAEQALKKSEEKYRLITENASDVIWTLNVEKEKFTYFNPAVMRIHGYTQEEAVEKGFNDYLSDKYIQKAREGIAKNIAKFMKSGDETPTVRDTFEALGLHKDGSEFWMELRLNYGYNKNGEIEIIGITRSVDERKKHEQAIARRLRYEENLAGFSNTLLLNEPDTITKSLNYLLNAANCSRVYLFENFTDNENQLSMKQTHEVCAEGIEPQIDIPELQHLVYKKDGLERWQDKLSKNKIISGIISDFPEKEREILDFYGLKSIMLIPVWVNSNWFGFVGFDETIRKKQWNSEDAELLRAASEILGLYIENQMSKTQLEKSNKELKEANYTKDRFISILGHDLRNPFSSILGFSNLLLQNIDQLDKDKIKRYIGNIHESSVNTFKLLENLLEWSRSQQNKVPFNPIATKLDGLVQETCVLVNSSAEAKKIQIQSNVPEQINVTVDREMIKIVIRNLISNAIKFTPENGVITISSNKNGDTIQLEIADTGTGMDEKTQNSLFKIGETKSMPGTAGEQGTGFGLLLCKEFIEKHNGEIDVTSVLGKGSRFIVSIPIQQERNDKSP